MISRFLVISLVIVLASCGQPDLDRSAAGNLINQSGSMAENINTLRFTNNAFNRGVEQGKWTKDGRLRVPIETGIKRVDRYRLNILNSVSRTVVSVTGIAELGENESQTKIIEFVWQYKDVPLLVRRFVRAGGKGSAVARLYDDGWRIKKVDLKEKDDPFQLTAAENSAQNKDIETETRRRKEEAQRIYKIRQRYIASVNKSLIPTEESVFAITQFKYRKRIEDGKVTLTNVGVRNLSGSYESNGKGKDIYFFELFEPKMSDVNLGRKSCYRKGRSPKFSAGWYTNATWSWRAYRVRLDAGCGGFAAFFESEEQGSNFRAALEKNITDWIAQHGNSVLAHGNISITSVK